MTPLGITNESLRALNFGAIINKANMLSGKHATTKLSQAKHSGNAKNRHNWYMRMESPNAGD